MGAPAAMPNFRTLAILLAALAAVLGAATVPAALAQSSGAPQCADGIDNDNDKAIDGADSACIDGSDDDEAGAPYTKLQFITVALPVVTVQGTVSAKGVFKVRRLVIRGSRGSQVKVACKGKKCPFKSLKRVMLSDKLRLRKVERKFRPNLTLTLRIARSGQLGKFVRYKVRRKKAPKRTDRCLDQTTGKVRGCFRG